MDLLIFFMHPGAVCVCVCVLMQVSQRYTETLEQHQRLTTVKFTAQTTGGYKAGCIYYSGFAVIFLNKPLRNISHLCCSSFAHISAAAELRFIKEKNVTCCK